MKRRNTQRGFLLITAVVLVVVVSLLVGAMAFMFSMSNQSGADNLQSGQALFLAESGTEYEQRKLAQNLDWYRSSTDPLDVATQNLGQGSFSVSVNLPATELKKRISTTGAVIIQVYSTDGFPNTGYLQIDDDVTSTGEYVHYSGKTATTFTLDARGQTVGGVTSTAATHERAANVYPVTTLTQAGGLPNSCTTPTSFTIAANSKFLPAGTVDIEGEEIVYAGSTTTGGTITLTGVVRCMGAVGPVSHASGVPVTPVLVGGDSASYQAYVQSTGTVSGTQRVLGKTIQR